MKKIDLKNGDVVIKISQNSCVNFYTESKGIVIECNNIQVSFDNFESLVSAIQSNQNFIEDVFCQLEEVEEKLIEENNMDEEGEEEINLNTVIDVWRDSFKDFEIEEE